jgi:hypothetical protein
MDIPSVDETRERVGKLLKQTQYAPKIGTKTDKHGMPIVAPEPDDPDDDYGPDASA